MGAPRALLASMKAVDRVFELSVSLRLAQRTMFLHHDFRHVRNFSLRRRVFTTSACPQHFNTDSNASSSDRLDRAVPHIWIPGARRTGVVVRKKGMTGLWDAKGTRVPVTVVQLEDAQVVGHKCPPSDNYYAVQVGCSDRHTSRHLSHAQRQWFARNSVQPKHRIAEFAVDGEQALVPIGTRISATHFVPGQFVDVKGLSKGKGFAGVMKRWGFAGGNASHGSTKHHRKAGSTGQHQDPGRVWPGKKMAGRMGSNPVIVRNLQVVKIDSLHSLVYLKGQVPGPSKGFLRLMDAKDKVRALSEAWQRRGRGVESGEVLPGIKGLPFPCGEDLLDSRVAGEVAMSTLE